MIIVWSCTSWVTHYWAWWMVFHCCRWSVFYCFLSCLTLLELHYGGRVQRSWVAWEQAKETRTSVRESEHRIDVKLFLDEYPQWELGTPNQSVILHEMFLHAAERGQKEGGTYGPLGQCTGTSPRDGPICHGVGGVSDIPQRNLRHLSECLPATKATRTSLLWGLTEEENDLRYPLFPRRLVA